MMGVSSEETGLKRDARDEGSDIGLLRCIVKAMRTAIRSSRGLFIGSFVAVMIAALGPSAQLATVRVLVDGVVDRKPRADLVVVVTVLVVIVLTQRLAGLAMDSMLGLARDRAAASAVADYLDKAARLDAGHLHDSEFLDRMRRAA